jgi:hypothetical protein
MACYFSPLNVTNVGVVNHFHAIGDGSVLVHIHCHVHHKGFGNKGGADKVASFVAKTLKTSYMIHEGEPGKK